MSKSFTPWTEEERRAHRRKQNATYQARKAEKLTERQKQIKEEERKSRQATKQAFEQGVWLTCVKAEKVEKKEEKVTIKTKNLFAALDDSDEEKEKEKEKEPEMPWGRQKMNWAEE
jgi:hypothetical protein